MGGLNDILPLSQDPIHEALRGAVEVIDPFEEASPFGKDLFKSFPPRYLLKSPLIDLVLGMEAKIIEQSGLLLGRMLLEVGQDRPLKIIEAAGGGHVDDVIVLHVRVSEEHLGGHDGAGAVGDQIDLEPGMLCLIGLQFPHEKGHASGPGPGEVL